MFRDTKAESKAVRDAVENVVARYAVALLRETGPPIGSGVLISQGSELFVTTAQHVAEALDLDNLWCIRKPCTPVTRLEHRDERYQYLMRTDLAPAAAFRLPVAEVLRDKVTDVALLRVITRPSEFDSMDFYPLERARSTALPHDEVVVCGFPLDLTLVDRGTNRGEVFSLALWGRVATTVRENFDSDHQMLITYEVNGLMDGHGMSGGGVWMPPRPGADLWNPDDQILVGVQIGCFEKTPGGPLVATRIERVTRLLV